MNKSDEVRLTYKTGNNEIIHLRYKNRDVFETFSFLLSLLKKRGLGKKYRRQIQMRFTEIVYRRGIDSKRNIFTEVSEFIEVITKKKYLVRVVNE